MKAPSKLTPRGAAFFESNAKSTAAATSAPAGPKPLRRKWEALAATWGGTLLRPYALGVTEVPTRKVEVVSVVGTRPVMMFASRHFREPIYIDDAGCLYQAAAWWAGAPLQLLAESVPRLVERLALDSMVASRPVVVELDRRMASALREPLSLSPLPGASGHDAQWLGDLSGDGVFACDGQPHAPSLPVTTIGGHARRVVEALRHAQRLEPDVGLRTYDSNPLDYSGRWLAVPRTVHPSAEAPSPPQLGEEVLPLQLRTGPAWLRARQRGVVDLRYGDGLVVYQTHRDVVLVETTIDDTGFTPVHYTSAAAKITDWLSEHARSALPHAVVSFDPRDVLDGEDTAALLKGLGITPTKELLELERALGGIQIGERARGTRLGLFRMLRDVAERGGPYALTEGRVDFGVVGDARILADPHGRLHYLDDIDGTDHLLAEDVAHYLERQFRGGAGLEPRAGVDFVVHAFVGARVAEAVGAESVPELSDAARRFWTNGKILIDERPGREGALLTSVLGASAETLAPAVAALRDVEARVVALDAEVRERLRSTSLEVDE